MKNGYLLDIIFCIVLMPGMMFLFPVGEWLQWHPSYVAFYVLWVYGVWLLCRKVLGPLLHRGWRGGLTVISALFLLSAATFLMSLTPVLFPEAENVIGRLAQHERAMWVLLLTAIANGIPVGFYRAQFKEMDRQKTESKTERMAREALEARRTEADTGEEVQVKAGYKTIHIPLSAIQYISGRNNYACFHLDNRDDVVSQIPLKDILSQLPEGKFVRIHRSYIVPVWRIDKRSATQVVLLGVDTPLPVGRAHKDNLKNNG